MLQANLGGKSSRGAWASRETKDSEHCRAEAGAGGMHWARGLWRVGTPDPTGERAGLPGVSQKKLPPYHLGALQKNFPCLVSYVSPKPSPTPPLLCSPGVMGQKLLLASSALQTCGLHCQHCGVTSSTPGFIQGRALTWVVRGWEFSTLRILQMCCKSGEEARLCLAGPTGSYSLFPSRHL